MSVQSMARFAALAACLFAFLSAGPSEVAAQDERNLARSARSVAKNWADDLVTALRLSPRREEAGKRLALQLLHPYHFEGLTAAQRRRVYDWLLEGLGEVVRDTYSVLDPARLADISRVLEESGAPDWFDRYEAILRKANARINVICRGTPGEKHIRLNCSAVDINDGASLGRASAAFELEWLNEPVALELAVGSIIGELLRMMKPGAVGKVRIVDLSAGGEESGLSRYIGGLVNDTMHRRIGSGPGWRAVGGTSGAEAYGLEGEVQILDERKLVLRVWMHLEGRHLYPARRYVSLKSIPKPLLDPNRTAGSTEAGPPEKPQAPDPATKAALHEAVQAGNIDGVTELLAAGAEVNRRDRKSWTGLMHAASRGYTLVAELLLRARADTGLRAADGATALHMASERGHLEIVKMLLDADADPGVMGRRGRRAVEVAAKGGHPRIVALLKGAEEERAADAKARELDTVAGYDAFLGVYREGPHVEAARGRRAELLERREELENVTYARARAADTVKAYEAYLAEYPDGRHAAAARQRIRERDDEAYAKARRLDTVEAYEGYPAAFPRGVHAQEARERMWQLREVVLGLEDSDLVAIQRGLVSLGKNVGPVDGVFGERTRRAIWEWQREKGMEVTGYLTREQAQALAEEGRAEQERLRAEKERLAREAKAKRQAELERARLVREAAERERGAEAERRAREEKPPGREFRDCGECPEMVVVPAGEYMIGSWHRVRIGQAFAVGRYEVTFAEWDACVAAGGCGGHRPFDRTWGRGNRPVIYVSWKDAKAYVDWLSRRTGKEYRLLSESEWEYVARAGTTTEYWWGDEIGEARATCDGCGSRWDDYKTAPVGSFRANKFGLKDVHGNVWEWVEDCWHGSYSGAPTNGNAWTSGGDCSKRVLRGGSWEDFPRDLRSANRYRNSAGYRYDNYGFRIARTLAP